MGDMWDEMCAALAACSDLSDAEVASAGTRFRTMEQLSDNISTLAGRFDTATATRNQEELNSLRVNLQEVKQVLARSQSAMHQGGQSTNSVASSSSSSSARAAVSQTWETGSSSGTAGIFAPTAMTTMREDLQKLSAATEWCVELMEVECQMSAGGTPSSSNQLGQSQRYDSLCTQLDQISHIEEALNMLPSASMDASVQSNSDIWVAVERVNNRLLEIHSEMAKEQKAGRQASQGQAPQQQQEGDEEWENWDRLSLTSRNQREAGFSHLSAVDDAERDLQLALDESMAHALHEQDLREDAAEQLSQQKAAQERELQQTQLADKARLQAALDAATTLASQQQVRLQQQQQQQQQVQLVEQRRRQLELDASKALAAQQQKLAEQRRQQQAADAAKVLAAQQQLRQQKQQQEQQQAQQQARLAAAEIQRQQIQSRLLQTQQQQSAPANTSGYNVYTTNRSGLPRPYAVGKCSNARYAELDRHAVNCPRSYTTSVPTLVSYLSTVAKNDEELARVLTRWVAENIVYDFDALRSGNYGAMDPESVLRSRSSVCDGYARLLVGLLTHAGMRAQRVCGCGKGISWEVDGRTPTKSNHAWVAVQIGGLVPDPGVIEPSNAPPQPASRAQGRPASWCLIEPCWAAGSAKSEGGRLVFDKKFADEYFLTRPELFVLDHLPTEREWQLLPPANIMSPTNYTQSQSRISDGWRATSHPLASISVSAAEFKRQPLRIRLELSSVKPLQTEVIKFHMYQAVAGSGGSYSAGKLLASVSGVGGSGAAASSPFTLKICNVGGSPAGLEYSVSCGSASSISPGNVFYLEAKFAFQKTAGNSPNGGTFYTFMPAQANYTLRIT